MNGSVEKLILVTGASSGIGEATVRVLNAVGATVIAVARDESRLEKLRERVRHQDRLIVEQRDLSVDIGGIGVWLRSLRQRFGALSGLVLCAGRAEIVPVRMWDYEAAQRLFDLNFHAPMALLKAFADRRNNIGAGAACVCVASAAAQLADKGMVNYAASKAALIAGARVVAKELAPMGIRVNCVSPTVVETPMTVANGPDYVDGQRARHPLGLGKPEDVARTIAFLLSDDARWTAGQNYTIDCASF